MEDISYEIEAAVAETHWWFLVRREFFARIFSQLSVPRSARILDVGTSSGTNLILLRDGDFNNVTGLDASYEAIRFCASKGLAPVVFGDACAMPFEKCSADFIFATDILEHLDDDAAGAREIARVLKPGCRALVTVPAWKILWGLQDEVSHHKRRYRLGEIRLLLEKAGLEVERSFYFNFILFLPILAARFAYRAGLMKSAKSENELNSPGLNWVLTRIFRLDTWLAPKLHIPFGVSICLVARKPDRI